MASHHDIIDPAAERFIDRLGHQFEGDGLTRISGRIFGLLLLTPTPLSLEQLASALQVSKGSVSQDTRVLERVGALERVTRPGDRRVYYQVGEHLNERMIELRLERFRLSREAMQQGLATPAAQDPEIAQRLEGVVAFIDRMIEGISGARSAWADERSGAVRGETK